MVPFVQSHGSGLSFSLGLCQEGDAPKWVVSLFFLQRRRYRRHGGTTSANPASAGKSHQRRSRIERSLRSEPKRTSRTGQRGAGPVLEASGKKAARDGRVGARWLRCCHLGRIDRRFPLGDRGNSGNPVPCTMTWVLQRKSGQILAPGSTFHIGASIGVLASHNMGRSQKAGCLFLECAPHVSSADSPDSLFVLYLWRTWFSRVNTSSWG